MALGLGIRHGTLRVSSMSSAVAPLRLCRSNARLFSSLLQPACSRHRVVLLQAPAGSRNLSWWPGSKSAPAPESTAPSPPPTPEVFQAQEAVPSAAAGTSSIPADSVPAADASVFADSAASIDAFSATDSISSTLTDALITHAPAALQYGDFAAMGLAGWSPAGLVRWSMEIINVTTGLPWFWTIVAGSTLWRFVCIPFLLKGLQASARMQPLQPQLLALQASVKKASASGNTLEMQKATMAMNTFYKKNGINPFAGALALVQMPITLGIFFGVQKMCKLPVEQLKDSGFSLLPDLTAPDPTMILPVILCAAINTQISVGARDINTTERPSMGHLMNGMRILTIPGIWFMSGFPVGLLISLLTTATLTTLQTLVLRIPAIRRALDIPIPPPETRGKLPSMWSTVRYAKQYFFDDVKSKVDQARREQLQKQRSNGTRRPRY